ncbi:hypothetical protein [Streptomyces sp. NBC_00299]|uniref:hypothetical protein n=1 Tax=Streptomyces sp. NBC_00299 TaxID=2975705 RepID=UPI002E27B5FB|nr:hypothetical protein [Streptomyces sp. NBC_00299]
MVAAFVLDAEGLWVESTDDVELHFMIHDLCSLPSDGDGYKEAEAAGCWSLNDRLRPTGN